MSILPTSISRGYYSVKNNVKDYCNPGNVFPEEKQEKTVKILKTAVFAAGCFALSALILKKITPNMVNLSLDYNDFLKRTRFDNNVAYYKAKPLSGIVSKHHDGASVLELRYENGMLKSSNSIDPDNTASLICKRYFYGIDGNIVRIIKKDKTGKYDIFIEKDRIVKYRNGSLFQIINRIKQGCAEIIDYNEDPKGIVRDIRSKKKLKNV